MTTQRTASLPSNWLVRPRALGAAPATSELCPFPSAKDICSSLILRLTFTSGPVSGKKMIVQTTNTGGDLGNNHFDIAMPGNPNTSPPISKTLLTILQVAESASSTPAQASGVRLLKAGASNTAASPSAQLATASPRNSRLGATGGSTGSRTRTTRM
jgi:hypothetical protein